MFDGVLSRTDRVPRREPALRPDAMPWQFVAMLIGLAALSVVAAMLCPDAFAAPFQPF
jgi:uncharacterized protein (DUF2236 family)